MLRNDCHADRELSVFLGYDPSSYKDITIILQVKTGTRKPLFK